MTEIVTIEIQGVANFKQVETQIAALTSAMNKLNVEAAKSGGFSSGQTKSLQQTETAFLNSINATRAFQAETVSLSTATDQLATRLTRAKFSLGEYFTMMKQGTKGTVTDLMSVAEAQAKVMESQVLPSATQQGMAHVITNTQSLASETQKIKVYQQALNSVWAQGSTHLINLGKNTQWAGRQLTVGFAVPVVAAGGALAAMFYNVDKNLRQLQAVYGIGGQSGKGYSSILPSASELSQITAGVQQVSQEMAKLYGQSAQDTTAVARDLAAAGYTQQALLDMTKTASKAMVLGETDQQSAIKATISMQNTYKLSATQTGDALNFFSAAQAATSTTMKDLIDAVPRVGPIVRNLGGSYKDLVGMLVAMKEGGVSATDGANALKNSLLRIIDPTKKAVDTLKGMGIDIKGIVNKNAGDLVGTITELQVGLQKLPPLAREQAITDLFGKFQASRMTALFDNFNKTGTQSLKIMQMQNLSAQQLGDIAQAQTDKIKQSSSGSFKIAVETLKTQLLPIGQQFLNIMTWIINKFSDFIGILKNLEPYKNIFLLILGGVTIAGPLLMISGLMMNLGGQALKLVNSFRMFSQGFREGFSDGGGILGAFTGGVKNLNNYFTVVDKSLIATRKLADTTKEATVDQTAAIKLLIDAIQKYKAEIASVASGNFSGVYAPAAGVNGSKGGGEGGSIPPTEPSPSTPPDAYTAAFLAASQAGGKVASGKRSTNSVLRANTVGTMMIPSSGLEQKAQKAMQDRAMVWFSEEQRQALTQKLSMTVPQAQMGEIEKKLIVEGDKLVDLESQRSAYTKTITSWVEQQASTDEKISAVAKENLQKLGAIQNKLVAQMTAYGDPRNKSNSALMAETEQKIITEYDNLYSLVSEDVVFEKERNMLSQRWTEQLAAIESDEEKVQYLRQELGQQMKIQVERATQINAAGLKVGGKQIQTSKDLVNNIGALSLQRSVLGQTFITGMSSSGIPEMERSHIISKGELAKYAEELKKEIAVAEEGIAASKNVIDELNAEKESIANERKELNNKAAALRKSTVEQQERDAQEKEISARRAELSARAAIIKQELIASEEKVIESETTVTESSQRLAIAQNELAVITEEEAAQSGAAGGMRGKLSAFGGKFGTGIGMLGMLAPMATEPISQSMGQNTLGGSTVSGAGTGAMYGAMIGSVIPGIGTALGAVGGALIGGAKGWADELNREAEIQRQNAEQAFQVSGVALEQLGIKSNTLANVHLPMLASSLKVNQTAVDQLASAYKASTDQVTKDYIDGLKNADAATQKQMLTTKYLTDYMTSGDYQKASTDILGLSKAAGLSSVTISMSLMKLTKQFSDVGPINTYADYMRRASSNTKDAAGAALTLIDNVDPTKWSSVAEASSMAGFEILNSAGTFKQLYEAVKTQSPELANLTSHLLDMGVPVQNLGAALNLFAHNAFDSIDEFVAAANNALMIQGYQDRAVMVAAVGGANVSTAVSQAYSVGPAASSGTSTPASGGSGGSGSNSADAAAKKILDQQIKAIQNEIQARNNSTTQINKQIQDQQKLQDLQNNIFKARSGGSLDDLATAQSAYNAEANAQARQAAVDAANARDQARIDALQAKLDKLNAASSSGSGGSGSASKNAAAAGGSTTPMYTDAQLKAQAVGAIAATSLQSYLSTHVFANTGQMQSDPVVSGLLKQIVKGGASEAGVLAVMRKVMVGNSLGVKDPGSAASLNKKLDSIFGSDYGKKLTESQKEAIKAGMVDPNSKLSKALLASSPPDIISKTSDIDIGNKKIATAQNAWNLDNAGQKFQTIMDNTNIMKDPQTWQTKISTWLDKPTIDMTDATITSLSQRMAYYGRAAGVSWGLNPPPRSTPSASGSATGGYVRGPGTSTSDSIPTMLSNGEYVISAAAVAAHGVSFFDAINFGGAGVGTVSIKAANRMSMGGSVGSGAASKTNNIQYNINVSVQGTSSSPDDIANKVMATIKQQQRINTTRRDI